ncbi:MAG TPA: hypothetical protein VK194_03610, partial [Candidatus Deferrimicrobium sp.]|nr:hypothetical protein [Candidatus Deferrimicrobium sp.]
MSEIDVFESRFATAYHRYLDEVPTEVDAAAVARAVAAGQRRPRRLTWPWAVRPAPALAWLVLIGLILAALAAALVFVSAPPPAVGFACPAGTYPEAPGPADQARPPMAYVAPMAFDRRASRLVLLAEGYSGGAAETWTFDVCTNTWTRMHPDRELSAVTQIVYDVDSDRTITFANGRVWAYDLRANTWTPKGFLPIAIRRQPRLVYDPATGLVLVQVSTSETESLSSELWSYDVDTDAWARAWMHALPGEPEAA